MWNPVEQPYRVTFDVQSPDPRHHGWVTRSTSYATMEEALAIMNLPFGRGVLGARVTRALNPETWCKNGRWEFVAQRKRKRSA